MNNNSMGTLAVGMMVGAAAVWACAQNKRQMHRAMKRMAGGAEHVIDDFDKMICRCGRMM